MRCANLRLQVGGKWLIHQPLADFGTRQGQGTHIFGVQTGQTLGNACVQTFVVQKLSESMCSGGKAGGDADSCGELRNHLAEAGVFTANGLDIGHSQVFKRYDQGGRAEECRHGEAPEVKTGEAPSRG